MPEALLPFILGFLTSVLAEPVRRWMFRSRLELEFDSKSGRGHSCVSLTPETPGNPSHYAYYFRAMVRNNSAVTAKACRAYLTKVERKVGDKSEELIHDDPIPLCWAFLDTSPIDIPSGMMFHCDVVSIDSEQKRLHPRTKVQADIWDQILSPLATYYFWVAVVADNAPIRTHRIPVEWDGSFAKLHRRLLEA